MFQWIFACLPFSLYTPSALIFLSQAIQCLFLLYI